MFCDIQHPDLGEHQIEKPDAVDFMAAFHFPKKYPTKDAQGGFCGFSGKRGLEKAWKHVRTFQALKEKKVRWIFDEMPHSELDECFFLSVDGVHC